MSHIEMARLERRLHADITQIHEKLINRIEICERTIAALEERLRYFIAAEELQKTNVTQNPVFEDEESDDSL